MIRTATLFQRSKSRQFLRLGILASIPLTLPAKPSVDLQAELSAWLADAPGGAAAAYVDADGVVFFQAGRFSPDDKRPMTPDTLFEVGSVTKVFTSLLLAVTEEAGRVNRDTTAASLLLAPNASDEKTLQSITLRHLATHASGLPRLPSNFTTAAAPDPYAGYDRDKLITALRRDGRFVTVGKTTAYSNLGVAVLGEALGAAWKASFAEALQRQVLTPLELNHTRLALAGLPPPDGLAPALSEGRPASHWTFDSMAPAGALLSSPRDMARFIEACVGLRQTPLAAAIAETMKPVRDTTDIPGQIGLAWFITTDPTHPLVWHNGATGGFHSFLGLSPSARRGVIVLTNTNRSPDELGMRLLRDADTPDLKTISSADTGHAGSYSFSDAVSLLVTKRSAGTLSVQLTGQAPLGLTPTPETDRFQVQGVTAEVVFERAKSGEVSAVTLIQNGLRQRAPRTREIKLATEQLDRLVGEFTVSADARCRITREGDQLFIQLTGQNRFPLYATTADAFFLKVVNARLTCERDKDGLVVALVLIQSGQTLRMPRI